MNSPESLTSRHQTDDQDVLSKFKFGNLSSPGQFSPSMAGDLSAERHCFGISSLHDRLLIWWRKQEGSVVQARDIRLFTQSHARSLAAKLDICLSAQPPFTYHDVLSDTEELLKDLVREEKVSKISDLALKQVSSY